MTKTHYSKTPVLLLMLILSVMLIYTPVFELADFFLVRVHRMFCYF